MLNSAIFQGVRFVMWGFPEPTQTFIHREFVEMRRLGLPVNILAGERLGPLPKDDVIGRIQQEDTLYLNSAAVDVARGFLSGARSSARFLELLDWGLSLGHRTPLHRLRFIAMACLAQRVAPALEAAGTRYLQAHFASYVTEWTMCAARLLGIPFGITGHAVDIFADNNALPDKMRAARLVMTCTKYNSAHLRALAPVAKDRIHTLYHGIDFEGLPPASPIPKDKAPLLLSIGRLVPKKGFGLLLNAADQLRRDGTSFEIAILGNGPLAGELKSQVETLGLSDIVHLPGAVTQAEVWEWLGRARALVVPSVAEASGNIDGIPNVALEAFAMERPVVGSALSGIPEVVHPEKTGWLVSPGDVDELAAAMGQAIADAERCVAMGQAGRAFVREHFDVRRNVQRQIALIEGAARG